MTLHSLRYSSSSAHPTLILHQTSTVCVACVFRGASTMINSVHLFGYSFSFSWVFVSAVWEKREPIQKRVATAVCLLGGVSDEFLVECSIACENVAERAQKTHSHTQENLFLCAR